MARWRWMRRRDAEAEGVVVGKKKLIAMPEDLPSERWEEEWIEGGFFKCMDSENMNICTEQFWFVEN